MTKPSDETQIAVMANDVGYLKKAVDLIDKKIDLLNGTYVTKAEFDPVKRVVYGLVGLVLTSVAGAALALVLR